MAGYTSSSLDGNSNAGKANIFLMKFQAQCSQVTCPAGYVQNPSQSNITCCVRSSTLTSSWTTSTTASTGITTSTSSTSFNSTWNELEKEDFVTQGFLDGMTGTSANLDGKVCGYRPGRRYFSYFKRFWIGSALGNYFPVIDHNKPVYIEESRATNYSLPVLEDGGKMCLRMCERNLNCSIWSWHSYTTDHIYGGVCHFFERNAVIDTRLSYDWQKWIGGTCRSQLEVEPRTSTTTAAVDVEIWEKPGILNAANTAATSSEHDSTGLLVAAVVLPLLTTCLCASLGICCCRAKLRQLRGAEAEPQVPNPLAMLPPLAWSVKPLIFSWNSRMTAEWPRGKVQKLSVSETAFELSGFQFQFRPGQVRHFTWEDGTVQTVQSIQKNVVWWSTQHPHPAWQRFRWVCTPKCQVENHHDMELTHSEGDGYRCTSCSRLRAAGKHWYCPQHQVHVCPVCAELPPEMPTLGLAATYLVNIFPPLARRVTSAENPNFYDICPNLAHGTAGMGYNRTCPRDGRPHCSIVDALEDACSGKVTHFVSWCWAYSLNDVVSAIERWVQKSNEDAPNVFLWMCFFCNNQYRIKEEATQTGSDDLKEIFESHLVEAGHMLVLLDTIVQPTYVTRAWCIFESYVSITQEIPMNIILPRAAETFFRETMSTGRINVLTDAVDTLDVRHARAGSEKDEDLIKRIIRTTTGFDAVNHAVKSQLIDQLTVLFRELFRPQPS